MIAAMLADPTTRPARQASSGVSTSPPGRSTEGSAAATTATAAASTRSRRPAPEAAEASSEPAEQPGAAPVERADLPGPPSARPEPSPRTIGTGAEPAAGQPGEQPRYGVEIRLGLGTLLGLDNHPADLPGWGPVLAEDARLLVERQHAAQWCYVVTDGDGYLLHTGLLRRRPAGPGAITPPCRDGVVEIHVRAELLGALRDRTDLPQRWAGIVDEIIDGYTAGTEDDLDEHPGQRFPGAGLRRYIQVRDRSCVAPGCRRPARKSDQDHTREYCYGGRTVRSNLEPLCVRHHRMKHRRGWRLDQPEAGRFRWTSPLGQVQWTRGEPIAPDLPDPIDRPPHPHDPDPGPPVRDLSWPIFLRPAPPPPEPEPPPPAERPPPF